jgi:hypothetical protein
LEEVGLLFRWPQSVFHRFRHAREYSLKHRKKIRSFYPYVCMPTALAAGIAHRNGGYPLKAGHRYTTMVSGL